MTSLILTLIGPDRPGLVDSVSHLVSSAQGNWLESRMAHLAGHFAGIVLIEIQADAAGALIEQLEGLETAGLSVVIRRDDTSSTDPTVPLATLELVGNDRPGIVSEVTRVLAARQVNVEEFQTECQEAPNSGSTLFRARAALRLPADLSLGELQMALEAIALDMMVDIHLEPAE